MKYILIALFPFLFANCNNGSDTTTEKISLAASPISPKTYYCSPSGSDSSPGTIGKPFATWEKLASVLNAGDTGYVRVGTFRTTKSASTTALCRITGKIGTQSATIKIWAYPGESPVFDMSNIVSTGTPTVYAMYITGCSWIHFKGLRVTGLKQNPNGSNYTYGWYFEGGTGTTVEQCVSDNNCEGFCYSKVSGMNFINCDAHDLFDPYSKGSPYGGSNGFSSTGGQPSTTSATLTGCRAWYCSDDGFDLFSSDGTYTFNNCWSFWNGYKEDHKTAGGNGCGYKLGPTVNNIPTLIKHKLNYCLSFQNRQQGYDQNDARCINQLVNCTSYGNGNVGYLFCSNNIANILTNNISFSDKSPVCTGSSVSVNNTWNSKPATANDFVSTSSTGMNAGRKSDGSLPDNPFMHLSDNSKLHGMGAYPDGVIPPPVVLPPAVSAKSASATTVIFSGAASDPQDESMTYEWSQVDGTLVTIINANQLIANATFTASGTYHFKFTATNSSGLSSSTTIPVIIQ